METRSTEFIYDKITQIEDAEASRKFIANVFMWMFVALSISALCSYIFAFIPSLSALLRDSNLLGVAVMFAPLAIILVAGSRFQKMSFASLITLFVVFSAVMGISLSYIFFRYSIGTISTVFVTAAVVFGAMAIGGYITHQDLTKFGAIMIMLLFGVIIASVLNFIMDNDGLAAIISYVGVAVFVGLTAYDVQKLKQLGAQLAYEKTDGKKLAIIGALTLYLDFVNLFLMLLRVFSGNRR